MHHFDLWKVHHLVSGITHALPPFQVLAVHEEPFGEAANLLNHATPNHEAGSANPVDFHRGSFEQPWICEKDAWKTSIDSVQEEAVGKNVGEGNSPARIPDLVRPVRIDHPRANGSHVGMSL